VIYAPWDARAWHTSVIDAAGAIFVIGGVSNDGTYSSTLYHDVWVSTDGGARPAYVRGGRGVHWLGTTGVLQEYYKGTPGVMEGYYTVTMGEGVLWVLQGYSRGT
jgi:hypothetical protein